LQGGHRYELELPANSPLLHGLAESHAAAPSAQSGRAVRFFEFPLNEGRTVVAFRSDQIVALETTPPLRSRAAPETQAVRSVADLQGPEVMFMSIDPIAKAQFFNQAREQARRYLDQCEGRRDPRRARLRRICDEMGGTTFVVSTLNAGFVPLLRNWVASCDRHHIDCRCRTLLFPMDEVADEVARELGFATYFDIESYGEHPRAAIKTYGDTGFASCIFLKLAMAQDMLQLGYDLLLQDMDMVWFADPLPDLESRALIENLDFQFMRDMNRFFQPLYYNSGFIYMRNNALTRHTWQKIFSNYDAVLFHRSDQTVVNQVVSCFKERGLRTARLPERYVDGQILLQAERARRELPADRLVAHVNWTANLAQKIDRLKKLDLWYLS